MTQAFLDLVDASAPSEDLAGGCVAKAVGVDVIKASFAGMSGDDVGDPCASQDPQRWHRADEHAAFSRISSADARIVHESLTNIDGHR